jgi:hypothetical protein
VGRQRAPAFAAACSATGARASPDRARSNFPDGCGASEVRRPTFGIRAALPPEGYGGVTDGPRAPRVMRELPVQRGAALQPPPVGSSGVDGRELRASCRQARRRLFLAAFFVGAIGIEPTTPTASRQSGGVLEETSRHFSRGFCTEALPERSTCYAKVGRVDRASGEVRHIGGRGRLPREPAAVKGSRRRTMGRDSRGRYGYARADVIRTPDAEPALRRRAGAAGRRVGAP